MHYALLRIWNDQNCEESTRYQRVDKDYPMPDYTLLTCDKQRVDGIKTGHLGPSCA